MIMKYVKPELNIARFDSEDIVTGSDTNTYAAYNLNGVMVKKNSVPGKVITRTIALGDIVEYQ